MKSFILFLVCVACYLSGHAQTQGLSLIEEFTGENCYPCSMYNPMFNILLKKNTSTVVTLKYQADIPTPGPVLYEQTKADVDVREYYYRVPEAPYAYTNGNEFAGNVATYTQGDIDNLKTRITNFDIALSHYLSADLDSIFITMTFTCTKDYSTTSALKAHIALVEENINFSTPPGSTKEKYFYMVMRKMYPSASGTLLIKQQWHTGDSQTITIAKPLPSYIYNISELRVVGFIQDNKNKMVLQAALSSSPVEVGIDRFSNSSTAITLFPNPAYNKASIRFTLEQTSDVKIAVTDILGLTVYTEVKHNLQAGKHSSELDLSNFSSGIYTISILSGESRVTKKLVVTK